MKYNELTLDKHKSARRAGRGIAAGRGKTAGRGTKGQGARKSGGVRPGFEGGQLPLSMRLPKLRGFKSKRPRVEVVYTGQLNDLKPAKIDTKILTEAGLINSPHSTVKLLLKGELKTKKEVKLTSASSKAKDAVERAGGGFEKVTRLARVSAKSTNKDPS